MAVRRPLLVLSATAAMVLPSVQLALADDADNGSDDTMAAAGDDGSGIASTRTINTEGGRVTFSCPSFQLSESWSQRTATYSFYDALATWFAAGVEPRCRPPS